MSSPYHQPLCSVCLKPLTVSWPQQKHVCNAIPVGPVLTCIPSEELDRLRALTQQQAEQIAELVEYANGLRDALEAANEHVIFSVGYTHEALRGYKLHVHEQADKDMEQVNAALSLPKPWEKK